MSTTNENTARKIDWDKGGKLDFFKRYDGPYIEDVIRLGNHPLRKILERQFEYMSRNLYYISAWGRYLLGAEVEDVVKAEDIAARTILNALESIGKRNQQAQVLLQNSAISDTTMYGKEQAIKLPITTPGAKLYGKLLVEADRFYSLNSMLWFHGEIDNKMRFANESEVRREVQNVVRGVASQFGFIQKKTHAKDEKEAAKAGVHNEEKLANDAVAAIDQEMGVNSMTSNVTAAASTDGTATGKRSKKAAAVIEKVAEAA